MIKNGIPRDVSSTNKDICDVFYVIMSVIGQISELPALCQ